MKRRFRTEDSLKEPSPLGDGCLTIRAWETTVTHFEVIGINGSSVKQLMG
jgi:hypothetical protein